MLLLLLLLHHEFGPHSASALPIPSLDDYISSTCFDLRSCRTVWNIVWSCLATIFSCAWVAVHRNMPDPTSRWYTVALVRAGITVWALLAPELILFWAIQQWLVAGEIADINERMRKGRVVEEQRVAEGGACIGKNASTAESAKKPWEGEELLRKTDEGIVETAVMEGKELVNDDEKWTRTHGFFVIMGGFYLFDGKKPMHPLSRYEVKDLVQRGLLVPPSEREIKDKSKGDALSKGFVIVQVLWFVIQCIARRIQHLPITELEVVTLAYTTVNVAIYGFWWYKPLSVMCPVPVAGQPLDAPSEHEVKFTFNGREWRDWQVAMLYFLKIVDGSQDNITILSKKKQVPTFYAGKPNAVQKTLASVLVLAVAVIFGSIHCIAWLSLFPSYTEQLLWRVSSIAILGYPGILALGLLLETFNLMYRINRTVYMVTRIPLTALFILGIPVYVAARVILLVLAFVTLRSLPPAAYETVQWTSFIPHI